MSSAPSSKDPFYLAKRETYQGFMHLAVTAMIVVVVLLTGMAIFLL